ncbi:hypothetical protein [Geothrix fuzhouensis]|uniref:hypothetical protein n=1 Tax=Geothrix fuzhouensis TaxID=2966451 RepID=UPI002148620F|nr:hypothetical protein [Geothrix fuzhouensis]
MTHSYYSQRKGSNPNKEGLPLHDLVNIFVRVYLQMAEEGFFTEAFGFVCVDLGYCPGKIRDIKLAILLALRKHDLWPIDEAFVCYNEDDLFDMIEFLFQHVSKPVDGNLHNYNNCGMHWETFNKADGQSEYRTRVNELLTHHSGHFELSKSGEILQQAEAGFEPIFDADVPSSDSNIVDRVESAVLRYRRHRSTIDDRRQAVRDLADVLEYLRPKVKSLLSSADENDLFNIANNFGIRHHNEKQKTSYDTNLWLSWMFYFYLSTIHVLLRKIEHDRP